MIMKNTQKLKELEKKLQEKITQKAEVEKKNEYNKEENETKLYAYLSQTGAGTPNEIYETSVPGNSTLRLSYSQLNNIIRQFYVYFARLDNPFKTHNNLSDAQKRELLESIIPDNY